MHRAKNKYYSANDTEVQKLANLLMFVCQPVDEPKLELMLSVLDLGEA